MTLNHGKQTPDQLAQLAVNVAKSSGGLFVVDPLARWGESRIWKAVKCARNRGLVRTRRLNAHSIEVTLL